MKIRIIYITIYYILDKYINASRLEELPSGVYEQLEKINYTEILWSETNRYLNDNHVKHLYGKL